MSKGRNIDGWLDRRATALYLNVTEWWLEKHHRSGEAPPHTLFGRKVWYRKDDLDTWRASRGNELPPEPEPAPTDDATLEGLFRLGDRAAQPVGPSAAELEAAYTAEHGSTLPLMSETYKRLRREFLLTLSFEQRRIFARLEAS